MDGPDSPPTGIAALIATLEAIEECAARDPVPNAEVIQWLGEILTQHAHPIVRHEAAFVLGRLRAMGNASEAVADPLCTAALYDYSAVVRHEAAEALWNFDSNSAEAVLRQLLADPDPDVCATAELSLARRMKRTQGNLGKLPTQIA